VALLRQTLWDGMLAASGLPATDGGCPLMDAIEFMAAAMVRRRASGPVARARL
jgi:hypothetical protein